MFVQRHDLAQHERIEQRVGQRHRRAVAGKHPVAGLPVEFGLVQTLGSHRAARLVQRPAKHQRLGLREAVCDQQLVLMVQVVLVPAGCDHEFAGDHPRALMDQLVERMLPVGAGFAPDDGAGVHRQIGAVHADPLAI